jgi:GAF domain-containing protein
LEASSGKKLAEQLRLLVSAVEAGGRATLPGSSHELLQSIVEAAARIFGAAAASICLVDPDQQTLEFKVAFGAGAETVVGLRIPIDRGIAGYVVLTGQPIAISDVQKDPRFNQDFARTTGYLPRSILATPLFHDEKVIGVMEVLDKISAPSFGIQDMELLSLFARQAAMAIHQSQHVEQVTQALIRSLAAQAEEPQYMAGYILHTLAEELKKGVDSSSEILTLADHFNAISSLGDSEKKACLKILEAFAEYARAKPGYY